MQIVNLRIVSGEFDQARMIEIFGKRDANGDIIADEYLDGYVPFTDAELEKLAEIPCALVGFDFFQNRKYGTDTQSPSGKATEFYNRTNFKEKYVVARVAELWQHRHLKMP